MNIPEIEKSQLGDQTLDVAEPDKRLEGDARSEETEEYQNREIDRVGLAIRAHNSLRSQLALGRYIVKGNQKPQAANMLEMTWDCDIEASAQKYANTCPFAHSHSPNLGENLYWQWSTVPIPSTGVGLKASNSWANEFQTNGFSKTLFTPDALSRTGHATQMSWASTNRMGCAISQCPSNIKIFNYMIAVVCQYAPQGNFFNQNIYQPGTTCSACPESYQCDKAIGLCTMPK